MAVYQRLISLLQICNVLILINLIVDRLVGFAIIAIINFFSDEITYFIWSQAVVSVNILASIIQMGFYHTVTSDYKPNDPYYKNTLFIYSIIVSSINSFVLLLIFWAFKEKAAYFIFRSNIDNDLFYYFLFYSISESFFELIVVGFLRSKLLITTSAGMQISKNLCKVFLCYIFLLNGFEIKFVFITIALVDILFVLIVCVPIFAESFGIVFLSDFLSKLKYSFQIFISNILSMLNLSIPRFFIVSNMSIHDLNIYSLCFSVSTIVQFFPLLFNFIAPAYFNFLGGVNKYFSEIYLSYTLKAYIRMILLVSTFVFCNFQAINKIIAPLIFIDNDLLYFLSILLILFISFESFISLFLFQKEVKKSLSIRAFLLFICISGGYFASMRNSLILIFSIQILTYIIAIGLELRVLFKNYNIRFELHDVINSLKYCLIFGFLLFFIRFACYPLSYVYLFFSLLLMGGFIVFFTYTEINNLKKIFKIINILKKRFE